MSIHEGSGPPGKLPPGQMGIKMDRSFADRLRAHIETHPELTPAGLAIKAGLDNSTIRNLLAGRIQNPRIDTARRICAALGTTLEVFMSDARTEEEKEIAALISDLDDQSRAELLGYARALAARRDRDTRGES